MRRLIALALSSVGLAAACTPAADTGASEKLRVIEVVGQLEDKRLREVSGLVASHRLDDQFWVINDSGAKAIIHAIDTTGGVRGQLRIDDTDNRDWEDLAAFERDGVPYLVVADIGDNSSRHRESRLYVIREADLRGDNKRREDADWIVSFEYPDGPRDAEAIAVDQGEGYAYVLTKRDLPARLYRVPLDPDPDDGRMAAELLGPITSLPVPPRRDFEMAGITRDWYWQPTAMDFSRDGRFAAVLTYEAVYLYARRNGQGWYEALNGVPLGLSLGRIQGAESIAFSADGTALYLTIESRKAPLFRVDLSDALQSLLRSDPP